MKTLLMTVIATSKTNLRVYLENNKLSYSLHQGQNCCDIRNLMIGEFSEEGMDLPFIFTNKETVKSLVINAINSGCEKVTKVRIN